MKKNTNKILFKLCTKPLNFLKEKSNFVSFFLLTCDAPDFWQITFQDPASSIMEGILLFNKLLLFIAIMIIVLQPVFDPISSSEKTYRLRSARTLSQGKKSPVGLFTKRFIHHPIGMSHIVGRRYHSSKKIYEIPNYDIMDCRVEIGPNFPKQIFSLFSPSSQGVERAIHTPENLLRFYDMETGSPARILGDKRRGNRHTADLKKKAVNWYKKSQNFNSTAERFNCSVSSLRNWVKQDRFGNKYSVSFKKRAVNLYEKNRNFKFVAERFGCSVSSVRNWVKLYWIRDDSVLHEGSILKEEHHSYLKRRLVADNKICLKKNHPTDPKPRCTVKKLKDELMQKFKVDISHNYLARVIKKMGFSMKILKKIHEDHIDQCLSDNWKMSVPKLRESLMLKFSLDISSSHLGRFIKAKKMVLDDAYFDSCSLFKQRRDWPKPKDDVEMSHEEYYLYHYLQCPKPPKPWIPDTSRFREYHCPTEWENVWREGPEPEVPEETEDEKKISAMLEQLMPWLIPAPLVLDFSSTADPNYVEITHFKAGDDDPWWNGIDPFEHLPDKP